jgi:hypothetical protein
VQQGSRSRELFEKMVSRRPLAAVGVRRDIRAAQLHSRNNPLKHLLAWQMPDTFASKTVPRSLLRGLQSRKLRRGDRESQRKDSDGRSGLGVIHASAPGF